jgi:hypothetical protein
MIPFMWNSLWRPSATRRERGEYLRRSGDFAPNFAAATASIWRPGHPSAIARQGYKEVREDRHPIIFIAGKEITDILIKNGYNSPESVQAWLSTEFPLFSHLISLCRIQTSQALQSRLTKSPSKYRVGFPSPLTSGPELFVIE